MKKVIVIIFFFAFISSSFSQEQNTVFIGDSQLNWIKEYSLDGEFIQTIEEINTPRGLEFDQTNGFLFYINGLDDESIRRYNMQDDTIDILLTELDSPSRIALDTEKKFIYFLQNQSNALTKMDYDANTVKEIYKNSAGFTAIEFDSIDRLVYFVTKDNEMYTMEPDGSDTTLLSANFEKLVDFKLDIYNQRIFYAEKGSQNKGIFSMDFNGENQKEILSITEAGGPNYINLDCKNKIIYYSTFDFVNYASYEGEYLGNVDIETELIIPFTLKSSPSCLLSTAKEVNVVYDQINIHPNPASTQVEIISQKLNIETVKIVDALGRVFMTQNYTNSKRLIVKVNDLPRGSYFITTTLEGNHMSTQKLLLY